MSEQIENPEKIHTGYADGPELADTASKNQIDRSLSLITEKETSQIFMQGLRQAASAARRLAKLQSHEIWMDVSILCDHICNQGLEMFNAKALSRLDVLNICDARQNMTSNVLEMKRKLQQKFIIN